MATLSTLLSKSDYNRNHTISAVVAIFGAYTLWRLISRSSKEKRQPDNVVPLVEGGLPILGHTLQLVRDPANFIRRCKEKYGPAFHIKIAGKDFYVLTGHLIPEMFQATARSFSFTEGIETLVPTRKVISLCYDHKFPEPVLNPRDKHPIVYPIKHNFKVDKIDVFSERIQKGFTTFLDKELNLKPGEKRVVPVWDILSSAISYISCPCFAGSRVADNKDLIVSMATLTQKIIKAGLYMNMLPGWIGTLLVRRVFSVEKELDVIMNALVPEVARIRNEESPETTYASMVAYLPKSDGTLRSIEEAAFYFKNVALASIHTTSHFSTFALHELACRPELVEELRSEIAKVPERTPEAISEIRLLDSFLREVLRYDIDYLGMHHRATKDAVLSTGQIIPKGSLVVAATNDAHLYPPVNNEETSAAYDVPLDQFDAHRFMKNPEKSSSTIGLDHLTFGLGAHACPGRYFAVNEIKYVLAELIMYYNFTTASGKRASDFVVMGMTKMPPREPLIFEKRE